MRKPFKKTLSMIPMEEAHGGSGRRQLILSKSDAISNNIEAMTKGFLDPGAFFDWHSHDTDEFYYVLSGNGSIEFKESDGFNYNEGDLVYIPSGSVHKIISGEKVVSIFLFVRVCK